MTEKNAFRILIKVMFDYEIRKLYENSFQNLHLRLYQLNRLIEVLHIFNYISNRNNFSKKLFDKLLKKIFMKNWSVKKLFNYSFLLSPPLCVRNQ